MRVDQMERDATVMDFPSRLLAGLVRSENITALRKALPEALPWSTFLPPEDVEELLDDLVGTARGAVSLGNLAPIAVLLTQWKHSAEVYADPALHAILTREAEISWTTTTTRSGLHTRAQATPKAPTDVPLSSGADSPAPPGRACPR
jgi:hypothetical protein